MKSFFSSRVSKFKVLMALCALGITTFGVPAVAADRNRELQDEISKRGISPEEVNRALKDKFPNSNFPYYEPVNGCSNPADIGWNKVFEDACNNHDRCYTTVGELKLNCDDLLLIEMAKICKLRDYQNEPCTTAAKTYYIAVRSPVGQFIYDTSQKKQNEYIDSVYDWLNFIAGVWNSSEGTITLRQLGSNVSGNYKQDNGAIEGEFSGGILTGYWSEDWSLRRCSSPLNGRYYWGKIRFVFSGSTFSGLWSYCDDEPRKYWAGNR